MSESDSSPENPKIPEKWKFPERNHPGLKVIQIDPEQEFIAFTLPRDKNIDRLDYRGEYGDYVFDREGNFRAKLRHEAFDTHITLVGDSQVSYRIHEWVGSPEHASLDVYFQVPRKGNNTSFADSFGGLVFEDGTLEQVYFGDIFSESSDKGNFIKSLGPIVGLFPSHRDKKDRGLKIEDWKFNEVSVGVKSVAQPQDKPNEVTLLDESGNKVYKLKWEIDQKFVLPVSETYLPSQVTKTLRSPVQLNMAAVAESVFARPPYQKEQLGGIDIL